MHNLSGKIDPSHISALLEVKKKADGLSIPFFIVGATARDLILTYHNIRSPRGTLDIDLGVKVPDQETFKALTDALLAAPGFSKGQERQRYIYNAVRMDIVPFGGVTGEDDTVELPPGSGMFMSTLGFEETYDSSEPFRLSTDPLLEVRVPTLPGLTVMKLISWDEKRAVRKRDAKDLLFMMKNYVHILDQDVLYEDEAGILKEEGFDNDKACIRLLGQHMAGMSNPRTLDRIERILYEETAEDSRCELISAMIDAHTDFDETMLQLEKLKQGVLEGASETGDRPLSGKTDG